MEKIHTLYRQHYSELVSAMVHYFGLSNFAVAEDIVQETFITAMEKWPVEGVPDDPTAWLYRVCKNKAINYLQRAGTEVRESTAKDDADRTEIERVFLDDEIKDSQLRLLFACCDDRLSPKSQIILILKNLCGLTVHEIANALLMGNEAVTKSLTRSKEKLTAGGSLQVPPVNQARNRLNLVHTAIYLMFSEGYSVTGGNNIIRRELCVESMRLTKSIFETPDLADHDTYALMALMCFHSARFEARLNEAGALVELEKQNRELWDKELIKLGIHYLQFAHNSQETSRFIYEAAIASVHSIANDFRETNWEVIVRLYDRLSEIQPTPFVELNRAVAIFYASDADQALAALKKSAHQTWLKNHYLYHALLGKIYAALGDGLTAIRHYEVAVTMCKSRPEQQFLLNKIDGLKASMN